MNIIGTSFFKEGKHVYEKDWGWLSDNIYSTGKLSGEFNCLNYFPRICVEIKLTIQSKSKFLCTLIAAS